MSETQDAPPLQNLGPYKVSPDVRSVLNSHLDEIFSRVNCHQIGTIRSFDDDTQTASVSLVLQRAVYNNPPVGSQVQAQPTVYSYPILVAVPCIVLGGGQASLQLPIAAGDECLVLFNDRDLDPWLTYGTNPGLPNSLRMHSLSDGIAIVGIRSLPNALLNYDSTRARLVNGDSEIAVGTKLRLKNATTDLQTVLDNLATVLTAWVNTGGSTPNPATLAAIAAFKTLVDSLLEA